MGALNAPCFYDECCLVFRQPSAQREADSGPGAIFMVTDSVRYFAPVVLIQSPGQNGPVRWRLCECQSIERVSGTLTSQREAQEVKAALVPGDADEPSNSGEGSGSVEG